MWRTASRSDSPRRIPIAPCSRRNAPKNGIVRRLGLRDEPHRARREEPDERDVDPVQVVDRVDDAAGRRDVLDADRARPREQAETGQPM